MAERKGEASKHLKVFQKLLFLSARKTLAESGGGAAAESQGKVWGVSWLGGYHVKDHGTNEKSGKSGVSVLFSRYRLKRP